MANIPAKSDIEAIFHRLRAATTNKTCFDCNAKNPTWATVTYGVFICIDCSAVHRSLGVHLTFVRSTNLDTNWTWTQIRQMQLGGNANAAQFFRQHNCNTTDAQQKYNSRAAQLYRDKLATSAAQAMKVHGTAVFIDGPSGGAEVDPKPEEEDFFAECSNDNHGDGFFGNGSSNGGGGGGGANNNFVTAAPVVAAVPTTAAKKSDVPDAGGAPSTDFLNYSEPIEVKSTIGVRKIQPRRGLAAGKKGGLGATKVKTNFADLEQRASLADQQQSSAPVPDKKPQTEAEQAETMASMRLAYQDLSVQAQREEQKLKQTDPAKAKQMERLGMGFNSVRSGVTHSALGDMKTITQDATPSKYTSVITSPTVLTSSSSSSFEKDFGKDDFPDLFASGAGDMDMYTDRNVVMIVEDAPKVISGFAKPIAKPKVTPSPTSSSSSSSGGVGTSSKVTAGGTKYNTYENDEAQKKFAGAKAISSDQYFNKEATSFERSANMAKFQGSNSISSAEYFGDGAGASSRGRNNYSGPDMDDVRESVRHGVTKVAGRLSSMANDMMSSLQDKYGG